MFKQRIARPGEGKSGGSRVILLLRRYERVVFVHGFEKKDMGNIGARELEAFKDLAHVVLSYSSTEIARHVANGALIQVNAQPEE